MLKQWLRRKRKADNTFYQAQLKKDRKGFLVRFLNFEKWINRPLASILVSLVFPTAITPNQLTVMAFIFGISGAALFAWGHSRHHPVGRRVDRSFPDL